MRFKRVAAAFDEYARVRKLCESSSGSEHYSPEDLADLSDLVESFIETEGKFEDKIKQEVENEGEDFESAGASNYWSDDHDTKDTLRSLLGCNEFDDENEKQKILDEIEVACGVIRESSSRGFKRHLMTHLRDRGFDAGLCKLRWEKFGRNPAGDYEYVDVNIRGKRYIVGAFLAGEFEIARPTARYVSLLDIFPKIFIGKPEEFKKVVRLLCNAIRESMKSMDMSVPPWRRNGYMQAKWFGPYKRTINEIPARNEAAAFAAKQSFGFEVFPAISYHCRDNFASRVGLRVGYLTAAFNDNNGIGMQL